MPNFFPPPLPFFRPYPSYSKNNFNNNYNNNLNNNLNHNFNNNLHNNLNNANNKYKNHTGTKNKSGQNIQKIQPTDDNCSNNINDKKNI